LLPRDGQLSPARAAFEQPHSQFVFERTDLTRQHRLRDVQPLGGAAEVQFLGHSNEVAEFAHVEVPGHTQRVSVGDEKGLGLRLSAVRVFGPRIAAGGSITLTSGTAADQPGFGALPVSICGAMNALTKALAVELAPIRVNAVAPGVVRTPLWDSFSDKDRQTMYDQAVQQLPLGRVGEVADTARAYLYCMEQEWGTGIVLTVDGGTTLV
jgi:Enoyl-(Acyl carrier protein) reductase